MQNNKNYQSKDDRGSATFANANEKTELDDSGAHMLGSRIASINRLN